MSKVRGSVKWFSNRKGFGFITPADGSPDIFVHQSSLLCDGYRTLDEGWDVEFEIGHDDDGKVKAVNVTAPGGGPCQGERKKRRPGSGGGGGNNSKPANRNPVRRGPAKPKHPFWHESLNDDVKNTLQEKDIRTNTGTIDVALGDARVKLGTHGYASVVHADGVIGEGSFVCGNDGVATFTWEHCISYSGAWIVDNEKAVLMPSSLSLSDGEIVPCMMIVNALYVYKSHSTISFNFGSKCHSSRIG